MNKNTYRDAIWKDNEKTNDLTSSFWDTYAGLNHWEFWWVLSLLIIPLVILFFKVDKKRLFEVFFFGYTVHMLWSYTDAYLFKTSRIVHFYFLTPILPSSFNVTASLLPVSFLLLYQYCVNHKRNFYVWSIGLSAVFAFGFGSIELYFEFIDTQKGLNQWGIFLIDVAIAFIAYWTTKGFMKWTKKEYNVEKT